VESQERELDAPATSARDGAEVSPPQLPDLAEVSGPELREVSGPELAEIERLARPTGLERIVFFSDAVFAIAITLLAIDLRIPDAVTGATPDRVLTILNDLVPKLLTYALSFFVIGLYWLAHWRRFHYIVGSDERLAAINLLLLGCIALIPFPTALLGAYGDSIWAVVVYVITLSAAGVIGPLSWIYAARNGLVRPGLSPAYIRLGALRGLSVPVVMFASLPLALIDPLLAEISWFLIIPAQRLISRRVGEVTPEAGP
jgi:uncharacterized membrane protein